MQKHIKVGNFEIGNDLPLTLIAGPCQIESEEHAKFMAESLVNIAKATGVKLVFKASFDKANRTSLSGSRGIGMEKGLEVLADIKSKFGCPVVTDIHEIFQCKPVAEVVDILQIPAFLCRQTDLVLEAANTGKVVNIKKGQFLAPWDMENVVKKARSTGNENIMVTERGASFGYNTLVSDMRALPTMAKTGAPVVFDATHSVQQPGGLGGATGGQREFAPVLAKAAVAVGVSAVFIETHDNPDIALSDGPNMIPLDEMPSLVAKLLQFDSLAKN